MYTMCQGKLQLVFIPMLGLQITAQSMATIYSCQLSPFSPVAIFGLESVDCLIGEGDGAILVCVVTKELTNTDCPVAFPFTLHLLIVDNERTTAGQKSTANLLSYIIICVLADFSGDHHGMSTDLLFAPCTSEHCYHIPITDDVIVEQHESFFVSLERPDNLDERITLDSGYTEKEVIILDDDSK